MIDVQVPGGAGGRHGREVVRHEVKVAPLNTIVQAKLVHGDVMKSSEDIPDRIHPGKISIRLKIEIKVAVLPVDIDAVCLKNECVSRL